MCTKRSVEIWETIIQMGETLKNLLNYNFSCINWDYNRLTTTEKELMTKDEFKILKDEFEVLPEPDSSSFKAFNMSILKRGEFKIISESYAKRYKKRLTHEIMHVGLLVLIKGEKECSVLTYKNEDDAKQVFNWIVNN